MKTICYRYLLSRFCCFGHDFWTRIARKPIKGSKDLY